ncbi:MAG: hypothetical protein JWM98_993 [Thermoleophilia bacterium]|nr:hypothetical protein [Thermoleophilia bacterium]
MLHAETVLPRPLEETFAFFADARNLEAITPPWLRFRITSDLPAGGAVHEGLLIEYRIRLRGITVPWRTRIERWDPPHAFVDRQLRGPYRLWEHLHTFEAVDDGSTRMRDRVTFRPIGGRLVDHLFVRREVSAIFRWRERRLGELLA